MAKRKARELLKRAKWELKLLGMNIVAWGFAFPVLLIGELIFGKEFI